MNSKNVSVELKVFCKNQKDINLSGSIQKETKENSYTLTVLKSNRVFFKKLYICDDLSLLNLKLLEKFREVIGTIKDQAIKFETINDSNQLLKKYSLRCPECNKKLLESWGEISGIEMKCTRCGVISTPLSDPSPP